MPDREEAERKMVRRIVREHAFGERLRLWPIAGIARFRQGHRPRQQRQRNRLLQPSLPVARIQLQRGFGLVQRPMEHACVGLAPRAHRLGEDRPGTESIGIGSQFGRGFAERKVILACPERRIGARYICECDRRP